MTDLNKLRSEFEATPEIKAILEVMTVKFVAGFYVSVGFGIEIYTPYNALLNFAWDLWQEKAKAQAVPDTHVVVPKGVLDLTRFMCKTWAEIDTFVYKNCTNLGEYPVIQGTSNQFNLAKIGNQKVDNKAIHNAVKWFLESESGAEG